jgi:NAD(P)-dependent dehydrogenase (short-subunit alcohol dehydrogenase family)
MQSFEDRRVLITGSGRGIGKTIAHCFAEGGAKVCSWPAAGKLNESRAELFALTSEVHAVALDLTPPESGRQFVTTASELWGGLDILVTNAGAAAQGGLLELDDIRPDSA